MARVANPEHSTQTETYQQATNNEQTFRGDDNGNGHKLTRRIAVIGGDAVI